MSSIKQIAREVQSAIHNSPDGWAVVYKNGRGWFSFCFQPDSGSMDEGYILTPALLEWLQNISGYDHKALCFPLSRLIDAEAVTLSGIAWRIEYLYTQRLCQLRGDFLECMVIE